MRINAVSYIPISAISAYLCAYSMYGVRSSAEHRIAMNANKNPCHNSDAVYDTLTPLLLQK